MTIGERIRDARRKAGISQERLAEMLDTTKQAVYKYESGIVANIPVEKVENMARILSVSPAYLMGWEEERVECPDEENPWELELLTAFAALDIDQQIKVVRQVNALAADSNHEFKLTPEGSIMIGKLTGKEVDLIIKYREKEHLQAAIDKLLDVKGD